MELKGHSVAFFIWYAVDLIILPKFAMISLTMLTGTVISGKHIFDILRSGADECVMLGNVIEKQPKDKGFLPENLWYLILLLFLSLGACAVLLKKKAVS